MASPEHPLPLHRRAAADGLALLARWLIRPQRAAFERRLADLMVAGDDRGLCDALAAAPHGPAGLLATDGRLPEAVWDDAVARLRLLGAPRPRRPTLLALAVLAGHPACARVLAEQGHALDPEDPAAEALVAAAANRSWAP